MKPVVLPELGEGIKTATVACWHVKVGQQVEADEDIVEVVTDKATFNVPAPENGMIQKILVPEGQEVSIGSVLAVLR